MRYNPDELFRSTAPYYARYRPGYPREFFDYLVERFALDGTQQVLDLGCGTGQIALPLAAHVARVYAVDPEPSMLTEGRQLAEERGIGNIDWIVGHSYKLTELDLPVLNLVTMGAAFHWMDRDTVLSELDRRTAPDGGVVVVSGGAPASQEPPPWVDTITKVRTRYLGAARRAGREPTPSRRGPRRRTAPLRLLPGGDPGMGLDAGPRPGLAGRAAVLLLLLRPRSVRGRAAAGPF